MDDLGTPRHWPTRVGRRNAAARRRWAVAAAVAWMLQGVRRRPRNANVDDEIARELAALRRVDVWQTGISQTGIARLSKLRPGLLIQGSTAANLQEPAAFAR